MSDKPNLPATIEDAKSPDVLEWALQQLNSGKSYEFIRKELGLGLAADDRRWREIRRQLQSAELPSNEEGSLVDLYQRQIEHQEKMMELLRTIEAKVKAGPQDKVIERKKQTRYGVTDLEPVVIKDTSYHHFVKYNMDLLSKMMKENQDQFSAYLNAKKVKSSKRSGVKINIYSNVPRPPELSAVQIGEDDDDSDL